MMGGGIRNPRRTVIPATWIGTLFTAAFYISTTIALLVLMQPAPLANSTASRPGNIAAKLLNIPWLTPMIAVIVIVNSVGGWGGLGAAVSRLPYAAGVDHLLPQHSGNFTRAGLHPTFPSWCSAASRAFCSLPSSSGNRSTPATKRCSRSWSSSDSCRTFISSPAPGNAAAKSRPYPAGAMTLLTVVSSAIPGPDVTNIWIFEAKLFAGQPS